MKIEVEDLKKINMLPGETLVIRCSKAIPSNILKSFLKEFRQTFPNNKMMLLRSDMEIYKLISEEKEL